MAQSSPRMLPSTVVQRIFQFTLPNKPRLVHTEAPLLLTQVCHSWRRAAYRSPQLWNELSVVVDIEDDGDSIIGMSSLVCRWLAAAQRLPLGITIRAKQASVRSTGAVLWGLIDVLLAFSSQWQRIDLAVPAVSLRSFLDLRPSNVPLLQYFSFVETVDGPSLTSVDIACFQFLGASVKHVRLLFEGHEGLVSECGISDTSMKVMKTFPRRNSFEKRSMSFTVHDALRLATTCPNLLSCVLHITGSATPQSVAILPSLMSFTVLTIGGWDLNCLFESLFMPSLHELEVQCGWYRPSRFELDIVGQLPFTPNLKHALYLRHLTLSAQRVPVHLLSRMLEHATGITHFRITSCQELTDDFMYTLSVRMRQGSGVWALPCPHLESLCMLGIQNISDQAILHLLRARSFQSLKEVEMSIYRDMKIEWITSPSHVQHHLGIQANIYSLAYC
ncbi:hypothetical protein BDZ89DRAFT_431222 [Hymenopellis radicata]|nr:hypothetical protein BDZ89DRAFT_431222 [Hymenopellis radicata]